MPYLCLPFFNHCTLKKHLFVFILLCGFTLPSIASHIVGGELFYECLGGNNYRLTLKLYRNCACQAGAQNCAPYGDVEYLWLLDTSGALVDSVLIPKPPTDTINPNIVNPCLVRGDDCIEEAVFSLVVNIPPRAGGYDVVYERCCRNYSISNYDQTSPSGSVYFAHIANDLYPCNSSPHFRNTPPLFLCANQALAFDNSAIDPDGDSLSYKLVDAMDYTGSSGNFSPNPAVPPPFSPVPYIAPYNAQNPTNSPSNANNLKIDPTTGLLTGIPNQQGNFVVAVAVSEYRNGVLIGQTIRDYQFNINQCNFPQANIPVKPGSYNPATGLGVYEYNCTSKNVSFNAYAYNPPPSNIGLRYHWDFGIPGINTDTSDQFNPSFNYTDTGTYLVTFVVFKTQAGQICSDTSRAFVKIFPVLKSIFAFADFCADTAYSFVDQSYSTTSPLNGWHWNFGDGDTSNVRNPSHLFPRGGDYVVSLNATNTQGCNDVYTDTVHVHSLPVPNFTTPSLCLYDTVTLQYTGSSGITNYYWDLNNGSTSSQQNPIIQYTTAGSKTISLITVTAEGCRDTIQKPLVVNPLPVVTVSPDVIICPFTVAQLTASGGVSYAWSPGSTLSDSTISNPVASPVVSPTIYTVTVTDANGCKNKDSIKTTLKPLPHIDAGLDTSVCLNPGSFRDNVQLTATGGVSYVWTPATGLSSTTIANPISRPAVNTTYYVTGTDTNGCKLTDSVTVFVLDPTLNLIVDNSKQICAEDTTTLNIIKQGSSIYTWTPTTGISNPNSNNPRFFPLTTTTYIFSVQNYCYYKEDTATIIVKPLPNVTTEKIDSVCIGDTATLHVQGALTYHWTADPTLSDTTATDPLAYTLVTNTYYVTGTDANGCKKSDSVLLYVYPLPVTDVKPDTAYICLGQPVQLIASGGVDYVWQPNPTLSVLNVSNPIATPTDTTVYYVRVYNIHQCHSDDSIQINVQLPVKAIAQPDSADVCEGSVVQLSASGGFYYTWFPSQWLSNPSISNPSSKPQSSIVYYVRVSNDCFSDTASVNVIIRPLPIVNAGTDTTIYRNTAAILQGVSDASKVWWYPGDQLESPLLLTTRATPLYTTMFRLYAISDYGCTNVDSVVVTVEPYTIILMPTGFSPNGDGLNDLFRISRYLNIAKLEEFAVFNRWGEKVFTTDNLNDGWDGTYKNAAQPMATYTWYVKAKTYDNEDVLKSGNITLVR
jgi:gliding motility-associated-like protein